MMWDFRSRVLVLKPYAGSQSPAIFCLPEAGCDPSPLISSGILNGFQIFSTVVPPFWWMKSSLLWFRHVKNPHFWWLTPVTSPRFLWLRTSPHPTPSTGRSSRRTGVQRSSPWAPCCRTSWSVQPSAARAWRRRWHAEATATWFWRQVRDAGSDWMMI